MKTRKANRNWKELQDDKLSAPTMIKLRGADGGGEEPPGGPIVKGP